MLIIDITLFRDSESILSFNNDQFTKQFNRSLNFILNYSSKSKLIVSSINIIYLNNINNFVVPNNMSI